jgi:alpha-tubulin suppressor-like RCC1 family protein
MKAFYAAMAILTTAVLAPAGYGQVVSWGYNDLSNNTANIIAVSVATSDGASGGSIHALGLKSDGTVLAWGQNNSGVNTIPTGLTGVVNIATGGSFSMAQKGNGTVTTWGQVPSAPSGGFSNITAVASADHTYIAQKSNGTVVTAGIFPFATNSATGLSNTLSVVVANDFNNDIHFLALKNDGTVIAWGNNDYGASTVPPGLNGVVALATGEAFNLALKSDGTVVAWGLDNAGQSDVPAGLNHVVAIAAGTTHCLALKSDGTVVAWGDNTFGATTLPTDLTGVAGIAAGYHQSLAIIPTTAPVIANQPASISTGIGTPALLLVQAHAGATYQWYQGNSGDTTNPISGANTPGYLPPVSTASSTSFWVRVGNALGTVDSLAATVAVTANVPTVIQQPQDQNAVIGGGATLSETATSDDPALTYMWQQRQSAQNEFWPFVWTNLIDNSAFSGTSTPTLTINNANSTMSGVQYRCVTSSATGSVISQPGTLTVYDTDPAIITQPGDQSIVVGANAIFATSAIGIANTSLTYQWQRLPAGSAEWSNLSDNATYSGTAANTLTIINTPALMNGDAFQCVISNSVGTQTTNPANLTLNYVGAWGLDSDGQTNIFPELNNIVMISAGAMHSLALKKDGTILAWGANSSNLDPQASQSMVPNGLVNAVAISAGSNHNLVLLNDGTVAYWGEFQYPFDSYRLLQVTGVVAISAGDEFDLCLKSDGTVYATGDNSYGQTTVPASLSGVIAIAAGGSHALALKSDGTVVAWGDNTFGECNVPLGLNNVTAIAAGNGFSLALKNDGTVVAWGDDAFHECEVPAGLSGVVAIGAGNCHCLALKSDGSVVAWGSNANGQCTIPPGLHTIVAIAAGGFHNLILAPFGAPQITNPIPDQIIGPSGILQAIRVSGASYQWYQGQSGDISHPIGGATQPWLIASSPVQSTYYWVQLTNSYGSANSSTTTAVLPPPDFTTWANNIGLTGTFAEPQARPFSDTLPNLTRYVMNLSGVPSPSQLPKVSTINIGGTSYLTLQYRQRKGLSGAQLQVESSSDLINWAALPSNAITQLPDDDINTARYEATLLLPGSGSLFVRTKTIQTP